MTEERPRTPGRVPLPTLALKTAANAGTNLFGLFSTVPDAPHPDFAARASIWRDQRAGLISMAEAQRRSAAIGAAPVRAAREGRVSSAKPASPRPRHERPSPNESRQYAQPMATTAARDDRLTPNAKAFLQVLRARCGKGCTTSITKGTAGNIMARSTRTIRRYLVDLVRFGYVELEILRNGRGMHLGLAVKLTELVTPFYEEAKGLARWLAETPKAEFRPFEAVLDPTRQGVTLLSPKNQTQIISSSAPLGSAVTSRFAARGRLSRKIGARIAPTI